MKLYRGLKNSDFQFTSSKITSEINEVWSAILRKRARNNYKFPAELSQKISKIEKLVRLQKQHFTDNKAVAKKYARSFNGALIEIDVPEQEILKHFELQFQNFGSRKKSFEIVYLVHVYKLKRFQKKWKFRLL